MWYGARDGRVGEHICSGRFLPECGMVPGRAGWEKIFAQGRRVPYCSMVPGRTGWEKKIARTDMYQSVV